MNGFPLAAIAAAILSPYAWGGAITGADAVTSPQGDFAGSYALVNIINQSGLSANYISGVTDFSSFAATTTHDSGGVGTNSGFVLAFGPPQQFIFDLGSVKTIDGLAFWSTSNPGSVTQFQLFTDNDDDYANGTTGQIGGTFDAVRIGEPTPAQVFSFAPVSTRYVDLNVLDNAGGMGYESGIGEIAFSDPASSPEPASLILVGCALCGVGMLGRRSWRRR